MNHNFKPGDLALVISSGEEELIGKTVEVLEVLLDSQKEYEAYGCIHEGDADGSPSAFVDFGGANDVWLFSQKNLMPLRGDFQPERQKESEVPA
ncbi:hypothetical protein [Stutzerimonas stutzeri]|uniref:Uncharacterized protein n=1 Tax=Stutzerimonas stutzeri KOS6 TaxID=1218352 RepID=A0A061JJU3_STUST|nr:hypothetical protein [Stutzerimonas stutzeri]EWC39576.1 hypothetical protein B597_019490 [Stutzerimonas stutzeri KOS6]